MTENDFPNLSGYDINELLYEGAKSLVYRGIRQSDQQAVVVKLLKRILPSHSELLSFRHQYNLLKDIKLDGVVTPLALESWQEKLALIMPDNQSIDLKLYCEGKSLSIQEFLDIASKMATILEQLHQHGITHKDIKPGNIIIHPETRQVSLIDFSIASQLSTESQLLQSPDALSGTLCYISPEQTGRMNRGIDYRTDFYSLGVTFYEILSAQLPFYSEDAMELVHSHLAREPRPLSLLRSDIPPVINDIVQKLMAKNAEDRYQTATGLQADIRHCIDSLQEHGTIVPFTLGLTDVAQNFQLSEKLYGRFDEVKILIDSFERVCEGNMEAVLISGLSGIGKTALVNEVHKPITRSRGYFISGKFDQLKRDMPFSALSQALRSLIEQLLDENEEQQKYWRLQIQQALGDQGQLLIDLIPELEYLIGIQPDVEEMQGSASSHRFHHLMQQFLQVFTTREHPLVLFLDDMQWIDSATLQLLSIILDCQPDPQWDRVHQSLLFIGAYRENETPQEHALHHVLNKLSKNGLPMELLTLTPLTESVLNKLVMDACHCQSDYAQALTQEIYQKTRGNPFFVHRFLQQAGDEGLLSYDFTKEHWVYDLKPIKQLAASADVVDFMAARLRRLEPEVLDVLLFASCFGHRFDLSTLALVAESSASQCAKNCWRAVQENLLLPAGDDYKLVPNLDNDMEIESLQIYFSFAHDRIQQAAYSLIPEAQKAQIHLNIGFLIKQQNNLDESLDNLFNVVNQLNLGKQLITNAKQRIELAELNYQAGQSARRSTAYEAARQYSHNGLDLLELNTCWERHYSLTLGLYEEAIENAFLLGDYQDQLQWAEQLLCYAKDRSDTIKTHQLHCLYLIANDDPLAAIEYALPILKHLGIEFPEQPGPADFQNELLKTQKALGQRNIASLIDLPLMTDPIVLAAVRLLEKMDVAIYIAKPSLYPLAVFKRIQLALRYGNAPELVPFYSAYGFILSGVVNDIDTGYEFGLLALTLLDKLHARAQKPATFANVYASQFYNKAIHHSVSYLREGSHSGLEVGDFHYAAINLLWANVETFFSGGELADLEQDIARDLKLMAGIHQDVSQVYTNMLYQVILNLSAKSEKAELLHGSAYQINQSIPQHEQANDRFALCIAQIYQAMLSYLFYDNNKALNAIALASDYQDAIIGALFSPEFVFYDVLIQIASHSGLRDSSTKELFEQIDSHQEKLQHLAFHAPMNFQHKWALVEAERCRILGDILAAEDHYDNAIDGAKQNKFIHEEALACELAARFYLGRNKPLIARAYMTRAYYTWARWGARAKTEHLEMEYPQLLDQLNSDNPEPGGSIRTASTHTETSVGMDLDSVMKCAHTLSSELNLSGLLDKLLNTVMENAGAQRTLLFLKNSVDASNHLINWQLVGECRLGYQMLEIQHNVALKNYHDIPRTLLHQVIKTRQPIALDDARDPYQSYYNDPYFVQHRDQQSVLCQPVLSKGKLMGLLYLENKLATFVFHQSRQQLMQMMAAQAAISIENANLYEHLEEKVRERTAQLKQAQAQLMKHAREAGMSEIAIEVMHNIGNALTPLKTQTEITCNAMHNSELVEKTPQLMQLLEDALETHKTLSLEEQTKLKQITRILPEAIASDYRGHAKNLDKACDTIRRIEDFIHLQSKYATVKPMNDYLDVNELVKDTLKMLENLLQTERIEVELRLDSLPRLYAEEYQLLQIILSVVRNACEAMMPVAIEQRQLVISTAVAQEDQQSGLPTRIILKIQDYGVGFAPELKDRIFAADYISSKKKLPQNEKSTGTGSKLHACANYLIANAGSISAQSEGEGKGALFTIVLPVN